MSDIRDSVIHTHDFVSVHSRGTYYNRITHTHPCLKFNHYHHITIGIGGEVETTYTDEPHVDVDTEVSELRPNVAVRPTMEREVVEEVEL